MRTGSDRIASGNRSTGRGERALLRGLVLAGLGLLVARAALGVPNEGGVLVLHYARDTAVRGTSLDPCSLPVVRDLDQVVTRVPADGKDHLVIVYAAFPKDSVAQVAGITFGIRYSASVTVVSQGACNNSGLEIPESEWPKSDSGVALAISPFYIGNKFPIYWFVLSASGAGYFELTPHPNRKHGGQFGTPERKPRLEPIADYGKIGFDLEGYVPRPGPRAVRGVCCMELCMYFTKLECDYYKGTYLGTVGSCDENPCDEGAKRGACCLKSGCELHTWLDCVRLGGRYFGAGSTCDSVSCVPASGRVGEKTE